MIIKKIYKKIIIFICNHILSGAHFFRIKRALLNTCYGINIGIKTSVVTPVFVPLDSNVRIGKYCWINHDFRIEGNGNVSIGDNCDIAPYVTLATGGHRIDYNTPRRAGSGFCGEIRVGDGCWICIRTTLLPNVNVGDKSVVAAGAIVNKDVENDTLVGGVPAKVIKKLV